ncbi:MAG TPA: hypothetical protein VFI15_08175 [Candidatus Limnocylindrales bacterium]|nr:hypothetical protein [Candidatus Limnocylindrales bacterium]
MLLAAMACNPAAPASPPASSALEASPAFSQAELESWIRFRRVYGLRADAQFVAAMAENPAASRDPYHVPLLPDEVDAVAKADTSAQTLLPIAVAYADDFPGFAGAWLELPRVVLAFTENTDERRGEAAGIFQDRVIVRGARFSLDDLQASVRAIQVDRAWFETVGAHLVDVGVDPMHNAVNVHIRFPDAETEEAARNRYGDTGWMSFTYDGPPPWHGAFGSLDVAIVDPAGKPAVGDCVVGSVDPRVQEERTSYGAAGRCTFEELASVTWSLRIDYDIDGEQHAVFRDYAIPADGVIRDTVTLAP